MYQCQQYDQQIYPQLQEWSKNSCPQISFGYRKNQWLVELLYQSCWIVCLPLYFIRIKILKINASQINEAHQKGELLDQHVPVIPKFDWRQFVFAGAPELINIFASLLQQTSQTLAGNVSGLFVFFAAVALAIFNKFIIQRRIQSNQWVGFALAQLGQFLIQLVNCLAYGFGCKNSAWKVVLGCLLYAAANACLGIQYSLEDMLFTRLSSDPLQVLGMEGIWGLVFLCVIMLPVDMYGNSQMTKEMFIYELKNTFYAFQENSWLIVVFILYAITETAFSWSRLAIMKETNSLNSYIFYFVNGCIGDFVLMLVGIDKSVIYGYPLTSWSILDFFNELIVFYGQHLYFGKLRYKLKKKTSGFQKIRDEYV